MRLPLAPQTIEALVQVISGGSGNSLEPAIGIYRSAPKLEGFMRAAGTRMAVGGGSRLSALVGAIEDVMNRGDADTLHRIIEAAASPADFIGDPQRLAAVLEHLNARLAFDGLALRQRGTKVELVDAQSNAPVVSALTKALLPIDFDTVTRDLERALANADKDPEDAVTSACSVLESVCRSILVELSIPLPAKKDVQSLYKAVRDRLALDPGAAFSAEIANDVRLTLSGVIQCVQGVGNLRTHGGDAHGRERGFGRHIDARIARLAIHTAAAAALFLIETWQLKHPNVELKRRD